LVVVVPAAGVVIAAAGAAVLAGAVYGAYKVGETLAVGSVEVAEMFVEAGCAAGLAAVHKLQSELQGAKDDVEERRRELIVESRRLQSEAEMAKRHAQHAVELSRIDPVEAAALGMLSEQRRRIDERLQAGMHGRATEDATMAHGAAAAHSALVGALAQLYRDAEDGDLSGAQLSSLADRQLALVRQVGEWEASVQGHTMSPRERQQADLSGRLDQVEGLLAAAAAETGFPATLRMELRASLDDLGPRAARQPVVVAQALDVLIERVRHELVQAEERAAVVRAAARRLASGYVDAVARLAAVSGRGGAAKAAAGRLGRRLERVAAVLAPYDDELEALARASGVTPDPSLGPKDAARAAQSVDGLLVEAEALFAREQQVLLDDVTMTFVRHQVTEALLGAGYEVQQLEGGEVPPDVAVAAPLLMAVTPDVGIEFTVGREGTVVAEAVSMRDESSTLAADDLTRVCATTDRVLAELRRRSSASGLWSVKEKRRREGAGRRLRAARVRPAAAGSRRSGRTAQRPSAKKAEPES
jgi:hypothetical protein